MQKNDLKHVRCCYRATNYATFKRNSSRKTHSMHLINRQSVKYLLNIKNHFWNRRRKRRMCSREYERREKKKRKRKERKDFRERVKEREKKLTNNSLHSRFIILMLYFCLFSNAVHNPLALLFFDGIVCISQNKVCDKTKMMMTCI